MSTPRHPHTPSTARTAVCQVARPATTLATATAVLAATAAVVLAGGARADAADADSLRLAPSADAYVNAAHASSAYGTTSDLRVGAGSTGTKISYLRFALSADDASRVTSAQLVLTRTAHHLPTTTVTATSLTGAASTTWSERAVTAANRPGVGTSFDTEKVDKHTSTVSLDVTGAVRNQTAVNLGVTSPVSNGVAIFKSREASSGAPVLVVTLAPKPACTVSAKLVSSCQVWFGDTPQAYTHTMNTPSSRLTYEESMTGRKFDILHEYNVDGKLFPSAASIALANQGRMLSENWKPATDMTWAQVAAGDADYRIDAEAAYLKANFDRPMFLTIYHEPEDNVNQTPGSGMTVADYVAMFRHVILRLRADGADKFVSVMNYMGYYRWDGWRDALYPGDDVVDWIAYDPYMYSPSGQPGHDFAAMVNTPHGSSPGFYDWATTTHPGKPIMIAEWGAYDNMMSSNPDGQAQFYATIAKQLPQFPALKAVDHFTMEPRDMGVGRSTAPWETSAGLTAWQQAASAPCFEGPAISYAKGRVVTK